MSKSKYHVYRFGVGSGCYARDYKRDFVGSTWAVSDKQAINQVKWREQKKYNFNLLEPIHDSLGMGYVNFHLKAFKASEDPYVEVG